MSFLERFAQMLGVGPDMAEDALRSERAARFALTRRSFFGTAGAMVAGSVFSFPAISEHTGPFFGVNRSADPQFLSGLRVPILNQESILKRLYSERLVLRAGSDDPYIKSIRAWAP